MKLLFGISFAIAATIFILSIRYTTFKVNSSSKPSSSNKTVEGLEKCPKGHKLVNGKCIKKKNAKV